MLMKSLSLAALKVVKMTTFSAASDEDFIKVTPGFAQGILKIGSWDPMTSRKWGHAWKIGIRNLKTILVI